MVTTDRGAGSTDPAELAAFLDTDLRLRDHAYRLYRWFWTDEALGATERDGQPGAAVLNLRRFDQAVSVSTLLTGGTTVIDWWIARENSIDACLCYRLASLETFLCAWRTLTRDGRLPQCCPCFPEAEPGVLYTDTLVDALTVYRMFAIKAGFVANDDGWHGTYQEPNYAVEALNEQATVPLWTLFDLLALGSLTTVDHVGRCESAVLAHLAALPQDEPEPYTTLSRAVVERPELELVWDSLTERGFNGRSPAARGDVLKRALTRLRDTGQVLVESRGKVSYWSLAR